MITRTLHRALDSTVGWTVAAGAWTFAIATYPAAVCCAVWLAPWARTLEDTRGIGEDES